MKLSILCLCLIISITSCKDPDAALRKELDTAVFKIDMLERQLSSKSMSESGDLVHLVYLNTQDNLTGEELGQLKEALNQLQGIEDLKSFNLGGFKDLKDERALSDYEVVMSMSFADEQAYQQYQAHPTHIALKSKLDRFLAGAPVTYDYIQD